MLKFLVQHPDGSYLTEGCLQYWTTIASDAKKMELHEARRICSQVSQARIVAVKDAGTYTHSELTEAEDFVKFSERWL